VGEVTWRQPASRSTVDLLQEYLVQTGAQPGDKLPTEAEFAEELGIGRTGVREGIQALQALGIVEVRHGRGSFLREGGALDGLGNGLVFWSRLSGQELAPSLAKITQVRMAVESSLVHEVLAQHDQESLAALESAVEAMEAMAARGQHAPDADRDFHQALYRPLDNWVLDNILHAFWDAVRRTAGVNGAFANDAGRIALNHREILEAVRACDDDRVTAAMREHFAPLQTG